MQPLRALVLSSVRFRIRGMTTSSSSHIPTLCSPKNASITLNLAVSRCTAAFWRRILSCWRFFFQARVNSCKMLINWSTMDQGCECSTASQSHQKERMDEQSNSILITRMATRRSRISASDDLQSSDARILFVAIRSKHLVHQDKLGYELGCSVSDRLSQESDGGGRAGGERENCPRRRARESRSTCST